MQRISADTINDMPESDRGRLRFRRRNRLGTFPSRSSTCSWLDEVIVLKVVDEETGSTIGEDLCVTSQGREKG